MSILPTDVPKHVRALSGAEKTNLGNLSGAPLVAISSVLFPQLTGYEGARFEACLAATEAYTEGGIPQIVMFGARSHYQVPMELARRGATVVVTPPTHEGLATPYLVAAQLVRLHAGPTSNVLKAEGDKRFAPEDLAAIEAALHSYDVVVGDRTPASMATMSPSLEPPGTRGRNTEGRPRPSRTFLRRANPQRPQGSQECYRGQPQQRYPCPYEAH